MRSSIFLASIILAFSLGSASVASAQRFSPLGKYSSFSEKFNLKNPGWFVGLGTGASFTPNSNAQNSFRGSGLSSKIFGGYYFGNIGLVISSGMASGSVSEEALNKFITDRGIQPSQLRILKGNPLNGYLLAGPSVRFGGKVFVNADLLGGLFLNSPGTIDMASQNSPLTLYRTDNGGKSISPGFSGSVRINYPLGNATHFFVGGDYLQSTVAINLTDLKSGIDQPTRFNREVKLLAAQVGITKSFGNNTEKRYRPGNNNILGNTINEAKQGTNCGPVTLTSTNADGSENQMTFACPDDAAQYSRQLNSMPSRLSMTPTTARQTQGKTFGEKVASGLQAGAGIISGSIYWQPDNQPGIITNEMAAKGIGGMTKPGGAVSSSYAAGKMANDGGTSTLQIVNLSISPRDNKTGLSAGKIQSGQVFNEFTNSACDNCGLKVTGTKEMPDISQQPQAAVKNPLYNGNTNSGSNPLYKGNAITSSGGLCGTTSHFLVGLYDANNGMLIATTTADSCGNFWFANVPAGNYAIRIQGYSLVKKTYQLTVNEKQDIGGEMYGGNTQLVTNLKATLGTANQIVDAQNSNERSTGFHSDTIILSPPVKGIPLKGVGVSLGKSPGGGCAARTATDENGSFVLPKVEKGTYQISVDVPFSVNETTLINLGAKDSGGNGGISQTSVKNKVWDGSVKGGSKADMIVQFSVGSDGNLTGRLATQDDIAAQSNKSYLIIGEDGTFSGRMEAQNFNTCRSNRERGQLKTNPDTDNNGGTNIMDQYQFSVKPDGSVIGKQVLKNASAASGKSLLNIMGDGTISGILYAQDFNTCRSNRDNRLAARPGQPTTDGSAMQNQQINKSKSNVKNNFIADSPIDQPTTDAPTTGTYNNKPGQPIGGIIVKGGRNPGGQMMTLTTNDNGEFSLDAKEAGTYSFEISYPPTNQKGIREAGIKRTEAVALRVSGGGKGIDTSTGGDAHAVIKTSHDILKKSISNVRSLATNSGDDVTVVEDGGFLVEITEPGYYVIQATTPEPAGKGIQEAGVKRAEAQNFNTTRSNRERGQLNTNPDSENNSGTNVLGQIQFSIRPDGSVTGKQASQKSASVSGNSLLNILGDGTITGILYAQDFNTCRSNRERGMGFSTQTQGDGGTQRVYFSLKADGSLAGKLNEQDNNGAQANTSYFIVGSDGRLSGKLNAQDFNTCRSNREN